MEIDNLQIGQFVEDNDKRQYTIINKTKSSVELFMKKRTNKGIDCKQWFHIIEFNKQFKEIKV